MSTQHFFLDIGRTIQLSCHASERVYHGRSPMLFPQTQDSAVVRVNVLSRRTNAVTQSKFRLLNFRKVSAAAIALLLVMAVSPSSLPAQAVNNAQIHGVI